MSHPLHHFRPALTKCVSMILFFLAGTLGHAQSFSGRIVGTVTDATGGVIPRASVEITNEGTGATRHFQADDAGNFVAAELPVGFYTVKVEASNLAPFTQKKVKVDVGTDTHVDVVMAAQQLQQTVTVTEAAPEIERDSATLAEVINERQVGELPLNGRDFRKLSFLIPGAAPRTPRGSFGSFTVNGQREKSNNFLIDGVDNNDSFRQQPSFNQGGVLGAPATLFPVDALQEFSIQSQGSAEYGRNAGAVFNIVIKSGTNDWHGSAFEFIRNDSLDARNFFETLPGGKKGPFKNNDFGGVFGGPIIRNRAFFFVGYEGQRERVTSPFAVAVPTAAAVAAADAQNTAAGRSRNALSTTVLGLFPPENNPGAANNLVFGAPNQNGNDNGMAKVDYRFSERFTLSGRYVYGEGSQFFPLTAGNGSPLAPYQTVVPTRVQLAGLNLTQVYSSRLVNETRLGYNRFKQLFSPLDATFDPASIGLVTGSKSLPTITVSGFVPLGASTTIPRGRVSSSYQFIDNMTWTIGRQTWKWGGEFRRALIASYNDLNARGRINFLAGGTCGTSTCSALANFLAGVFSTSGTTILRGATRRDTYTNNYGLFFQDDWRLNPHLTLNLGLRYEYVGVLKDQHNRLSNFLPSQGLVLVGTSALPDLYKPDHNNFAPRVGFAWDFTGKGKTVVRGAYGVYYDTPSQDFFLVQAFGNAGNGNIGTNPFTPFGTFNVTFSSQPPPWHSGVPVFGTATSPNPPVPIFAVDQNLRTPYVHNYNLNIQQGLGPATVLQVSYVGSAAHKLFRTRDINQATPGPAATRQSRRPFNAAFPQFSFINFLETSSNSNYNAFETFLRQRMWKGLTLYVAYTWSKSIDDASNGLESGTRGMAFPQDSTNTRAERALSIHDLRHRLTFNFVYDFLPLARWLPSWPKQLTEEWQVSAIYTKASGLPATPFLGADISGTGELNDRPNRVGDPNSGGLQTFSSWFNKAAFARPTPGTFGNAGRNIVIGPGTNIADFSLDKMTKISERVSIQFRSEFFNIFNHPNFTIPNMQVDSSAFSSISATPDVQAGNPRLGDGGPRVIQFGLKLLF